MPWGRLAKLCGWGLACAGFLFGRAGSAAEIPGARLEVVRSPGAQSCPDTHALTRTLRERLGAGASIGGAPVVIEVEIRASGDAFAATVRASGGKRGVRTLSADGPSCDGLSEALVVSLLVLLDRDPERPELERAPPRPTRGPELSFWLSGGGALTYGLPDELSGALIGEAGARYGPYALWLGGVHAPERTIPFRLQGHVLVRANGGQLRACTLLWESGSLRADGCALGLLLALRGSAAGYTTDDPKVRPWWLFGAGGDLAFLPAPWLALGVTGRVLIAPKQEEFSIKGLEAEGPAYETKPVIGWLGLFLSAKIW